MSGIRNEGLPFLQKQHHSMDYVWYYSLTPFTSILICGLYTPSTQNSVVIKAKGGGLFFEYHSRLWCSIFHQKWYIYMIFLGIFGARTDFYVTCLLNITTILSDCTLHSIIYICIHYSQYSVLLIENLYFSGPISGFKKDDIDAWWLQATQIWSIVYLIYFGPIWFNIEMIICQHDYLSSYRWHKATSWENMFREMADLPCFIV